MSINRCDMFLRAARATERRRNNKIDMSVPTLWYNNITNELIIFNIDGSADTICLDRKTKEGWVNKKHSLIRNINYAKGLQGLIYDFVGHL